MVYVDVALVADQVVPPDLQCVHYGRELKVMGCIILFVLSKLMQSLRNDFAFLHKNTV